MEVRSRLQHAGDRVNAGLLAVRILSGFMPHLHDAMQRYMKDMESAVLDKVVKLEATGWENY